MYAIRSYYEKRDFTFDLQGAGNIIIKNIIHRGGGPVSFTPCKNFIFQGNEVYGLSENGRITSYNVCYTKLLRVFSSLNGVDWDDHGSVLSLDKLNQQGWNVYNAWAPDCVRKDSLFYLYFPVKGIDDKNWKIGVATSPYPKGPFERPRIVVESWGIDPSVLVDDDGRAYLYCQFKMGELNADMSSVKEETAVELADVAQIPYEGYEGPFVFKRA